MVRFLSSGRSCAVLAILMTLAAGCGTGRAHAAPAGQPRSPRPHPAPSATGVVKRADSLTGVACLPAGTCVAVGGYYDDATGPSLTLAMRWNGRAWLAVPASSRGHDSQLDGVSCATATSCNAVGFYLDASGVQFALAQTWNGTAWSNKSVPSPAGGQESVLSGISCTTVNFCEAVGSYTNSTNLNIEKLAAGFNGAHWTLQTDSRPMSVSDAQLAGVSCTSNTFCRAAGISNYDGTTTTTGPRPAIDAGP